MYGARFIRTLCASAAAILLAAAPAGAEDFYKGKAVKVIINLSAGGNVSIESELFTQYWTKHVPGNPDFVIQPMPGGGNTKGIDYVMKSAKPDGLTIGWFGSSAATRAVGPKSQQIDWSPIYDTVIGANGGGTLMYARKDIGIGKASDIKGAKGIVLGGQDPSSRLDTAGRLAFQMLGIEYRYVTGYKGGAPINAALLRNEINVQVTPPGAYLARYIDNAVTPGIAVPLWYFAAYRSDGKAVELPDLQRAGVKSFKEVYEEIKGAPPSGKIWEALKFMADVTEFTSSLVAAPPGTPADKVAILREAFMKTTTDPEYLAAARKQGGTTPTFADAEQVRKTLMGIASADPAMLDIIRKDIETHSVR